MAQGDVKTFGAHNVGAGSTFDIQPASGDAYAITAIEIEAGKSGCEVYRTANGTNFVKVGTFTDTFSFCVFHATNTFWLRLKNIDAGAAGIFAHGRQVV
jgi:hypothetical protein